MAKIAFIGLGVMGGPMAGHLVRTGHEVTVYNRTRAKAQSWSETHGAPHATTAAEAAQGADAVITCVGTDGDVEEVTLWENGAFGTLGRGTLFIDHSTVSAGLARKIAAAGAEKGTLCVDAPVSGGQAGAENGTLAIMCGGEKRAMALAEPIMKSYASRIVHCGPPGAGQQTKMCNQLAIAGVLQGLSEALHLAKRSDLNLERVFEAISGGAAQSWQMDNRWQTMAQGEFDFGFAVDWMRKDLGLAFEEAERVGAKVELARLIDGYYAEVQQMGGARQDTSSLVRRLEE